MPKDLNFAVVGLGMGMHHCKAICAAKGAQLAAVCDHDEERLGEAVKEYDVKGYLRWADLLKDPEVDVINVCVESGKHSDFAMAAAKAGKHVIVEKPVEITPARIRKLRDTIDKTGVTCGVIFQSRFEPCNIAIKKAIDKGKMGSLFGVHACLPWFRADSYYSGAHGSWKGTWKLDGGGSLMNQGIHTVDLIQWLAGPVEEVCGFHGVFNHDIETEDQTVAILRFASGALGTLYTTTCAIPDGAQRIHIYGSKGSFCKQGPGLEFWELGTPKERQRMMERFGANQAADTAGADPMAIGSDGHVIIIEDMVKAIRQKREPAITIESATHAVEIANAIFKSGKTGKAVKVAGLRK